MNKVHDSEILDYQIDFENSRINMALMTELGVQVTVTFNGFFVFQFEDQMPNSIILDIVEGKTQDFVEENKELLEIRKNYGWPMDYEDTVELMDHINKNNYHYFKIQSSYGLNGWVLSKSVDYNQ